MVPYKLSLSLLSNLFMHVIKLDRINYLAQIQSGNACCSDGYRLTVSSCVSDHQKLPVVCIGSGSRTKTFNKTHRVPQPPLNS